MPVFILVLHPCLYKCKCRYSQENVRILQLTYRACPYTCRFQQYFYILLYLQCFQEKYLSLKKYGGIKKFSCFIGQYPDGTFMLEEFKTPPKLSGFIKGTPYRVKICSENNDEVSEI